MGTNEGRPTPAGADAHACDLTKSLHQRWCWSVRRVSARGGGWGRLPTKNVGLRSSPALAAGQGGLWAAHHPTEDPPHTSSLLQEVQGSVEPGNNAGLRSDAVPSGPSHHDEKGDLAMLEDVYRKLARQLDAIPNGFPATESGVELRLLAKLFTPEEAGLASSMRLAPDPAADIAARAGVDAEKAYRSTQEDGVQGAD